MKNFNCRQHWENIYKSKQLCEVSWYQPTPSTSLKFITYFNISTTAKIIDIGGGDSFFVDYLLNLGYQNITVLYISETAIKRAKERLGERTDKVKWIVSDATTFKPTEKYDFWHDRAAFHFLTEESESYIKISQQGIQPECILVIGTFSKNGPSKCSGIGIKQFSEESMSEWLGSNFEKIKCITVDHQTPFETLQNFIFCTFRKLRVID